LGGVAGQVTATAQGYGQGSGSAVARARARARARLGWGWRYLADDVALVDDLVRRPEGAEHLLQLLGDVVRGAGLEEKERAKRET